MSSAIADSIAGLIFHPTTLHCWTNLNPTSHCYRHFMEKSHRVMNRIVIKLLSRSTENSMTFSHSLKYPDNDTKCPDNDCMDILLTLQQKNADNNDMKIPKSKFFEEHFPISRHQFQIQILFPTFRHGKISTLNAK